MQVEVSLASESRLTGATLEVSRVDTPLRLNLTDKLKNSHLKLFCQVIFDIADIPTSYLRVSPEGVQWITPEEVIRYMVESNTKWKVDIN